jgi:peptidoglycan/LPS O-acetylase OafA/YrhL
MKDAAGVALLALVAMPYFTAGQTRVIVMLTAGYALVITLAAAGEACSPLWIWKPLITLGEASYSLYLVHALVQKLVNELAPAADFADRSLPVRLLVLGSYSFAIALATWLAHVWVDTKFRDSIRRQFAL